MRAALLETSIEPAGVLNVVDDIDIADPGPGEVRVRVTHCGVCHSDLGIVDGTFPNFGADRPRPRSRGHRRRGRRGRDRVAAR